MNNLELLFPKCLVTFEGRSNGWWEKKGNNGFLCPGRSQSKIERKYKVWYVSAQINIETATPEMTRAVLLTSQAENVRFTNQTRDIWRYLYTTDWLGIIDKILEWIKYYIMKIQVLCYLLISTPYFIMNMNMNLIVRALVTILKI